MKNITSRSYVEQLGEIRRAARGKLVCGASSIGELQQDAEPLTFLALLATLDVRQCPTECVTLYRAVCDGAVWDAYWAGVLAHPDGDAYTTASLLRQLAPSRHGE